MDNIISNQIKSKISSSKRGTIFSINDFYDLGNKNTVKSALYRLNLEKFITRIMDGLYTRPQYSKILKEFSYPAPNKIANKLAEKYAWTICPYGDTALNQIGLSTQIPNEYIYISDGPYRQYLYRGRKIIFKHTSKRNISIYNKNLLLIIQSIKHLGPKNIDISQMQIIQDYAKNNNINLTSNITKLPYEIQKTLLKIEEYFHGKLIKN